MTGVSNREKQKTVCDLMPSRNNTRMKTQYQITNSLYHAQNIIYGIMEAHLIYRKIPNIHIICKIKSNCVREL